MPLEIENVRNSKKRRLKLFKIFFQANQNLRKCKSRKSENDKQRIRMQKHFTSESADDRTIRQNNEKIRQREKKSKMTPEEKVKFLERRRAAYDNKTITYGSNGNLQASFHQEVITVFNDELVATQCTSMSVVAVLKASIISANKLTRNTMNNESRRKTPNAHPFSYN